MPRIPVTITQSASSGQPATTTKSLGPAQSREQFTGPNARPLNRIQSAIRDALAVIKAMPFANGNLVQAVAFSSGTAKSVQHGLGRAYVGYMVINVQGAGATFHATAPTDPRLSTTQITLTASATCTADVWIY